MTLKCSICKARSQNSGYYRNRFLCPECQYEYKAIFDGWQSNKSKKSFNLRKAWDADFKRSHALWSDFWNNWREANGLTNDGVGSE
jgi:hypothetical protein